jgi:hypothetical protein
MWKEGNYTTQKEEKKKGEKCEEEASKGIKYRFEYYKEEERRQRTKRTSHLASLSAPASISSRTHSA